jgi:TIR domain
MKERLQVFISSIQDDRAYAEQFADALVARGATPTGRLAFAEGEVDEDQLREALLAANTCVILLSEAALEAPWIFFELGAAIVGGKHLLLVYLTERARREAPRSFQKATTIDAVALWPEDLADRVVELANAA